MILYADRILAGDRTTVWEDRAVCVQDGAIRQIGSLAQLQAAYPEEPVETEVPEQEPVERKMPE